MIHNFNERSSDLILDIIPIGIKNYLPLNNKVTRQLHFVLLSIFWNLDCDGIMLEIRNLYIFNEDVAIMWHIGAYWQIEILDDDNFILKLTLISGQKRAKKNKQKCEIRVLRTYILAVPVLGRPRPRFTTHSGRPRPWTSLKYPKTVVLRRPGLKIKIIDSKLNLSRKILFLPAATLEHNNIWKSYLQQSHEKWAKTATVKIFSR